MISAFGANKDQIKVLLNEITKYTNKRKQQEKLESRLFKKKIKKSRVHTQLDTNSSMFQSFGHPGVAPDASFMSGNKNQLP